MVYMLFIILFLLLFLWITHYTQHFHGRCLTSSTSVYSVDDDDEFDFFPVSFLLYLTVLVMINILLLSISIMDNTLLYPRPHPIESDHTLHILDYVFLYLILLLSVWVSLFSFYRYYTTLISVMYLETASTSKLFKLFSIFAAVLLVLYAIQIHFFYWLFPLVIIVFCVFNIYCTYCSSAMLIKQYTAFLEHTTTDLCFELDHVVLKRIIFTKRISLLCCALYSMDLGAFIIVYNRYTVHLMLYLSISWCISAFMFSLNFKRNSRFWKHLLFRCQKDTIVRTISDRLSTVHMLPGRPRAPRAPPTTPIDRSSTTTKPKLDLAASFVGAFNELEYRSFDQDQNADAQAGNNASNSKQEGTVISRSADVDPNTYDTKKIYGPRSLQRALTDPLVLEKEKQHLSVVEESKEVSTSYIMPTNIKVTTSADTLTVPRVPKAKALQLLGVTHSLQSQNYTKRRASVSRAPIQPLCEEQKDVHCKDDDDSFAEPLPGVTPLPLDIKPTALGEEIFDDINDIIFDIPDSIEKNSSTGSTGLYMKSAGDIFKERVHNKPNLLNVQSEHCLQSGEIDHMFRSFNIFAKQGFCSQEDINSVKEISKYTSSVLGHSEEQIVYPSTYGNMLSVLTPYE